MAKSLTKAVTHVITAEGEKETAKLSKARDQGVKIVKVRKFVFCRFFFLTGTCRRSS